MIFLTNRKGNCLVLTIGQLLFTKATFLSSLRMGRWCIRRMSNGTGCLTLEEHSPESDQYQFCQCPIQHIPFLCNNFVTLFVVVLFQNVKADLYLLNKDLKTSKLKNNSLGAYPLPDSNSYRAYDVVRVRFLRGQLGLLLPD